MPWEARAHLVTMMNEELSVAEDVVDEYERADVQGRHASVRDGPDLHLPVHGKSGDPGSHFRGC